MSLCCALYDKKNQNVVDVATNTWKKKQREACQDIQHAFSRRRSASIETSSWNQRFFSEPPQLIRDSHYMVLPQTFLYRISTMQSFKSYKTYIKSQLSPFSKRRLRLWIRLRLAWPRRLIWILRMLCVYVWRASDESTEPQPESKPEDVVLKRALWILQPISNHKRWWLDTQIWRTVPHEHSPTLTANARA